MISVLCSCGRKFKADDHHAGKRTRCPVCGNMLVIGQLAENGPSNVNDNGEMPSWWFPSGSPSKTTTPTSPPPTRSGSDPDDVQTAVISSHPGSHPEIPSPGSVGARATGRSKIVMWVICGALACAVMGMGVFLWLQGTGKNSGVAVVGLPGSAQLSRKPETGENPPQADQASRVKSTDQGPAEFTMRWTQSQAQDFGERGKVLLDVEDNRFLIPDTDALPQRERELLQRYVYW